MTVERTQEILARPELIAWLEDLVLEGWKAGLSLLGRIVLLISFLGVPGSCLDSVYGTGNLLLRVGAGHC